MQSETSTSQPEEMAQELCDEAVLQVLTAGVWQAALQHHLVLGYSLAPPSRGALPLEAYPAQSHQEALHVGPLRHLVLRLVLGTVVASPLLAHPAEGLGRPAALDLGLGVLGQVVCAALPVH